MELYQLIDTLTGIVETEAWLPRQEIGPRNAEYSNSGVSLEWQPVLDSKGMKPRIDELEMFTRRGCLA